MLSMEGKVNVPFIHWMAWSIKYRRAG